MCRPYTGLFLWPDPRCLARESHAPDSGTAATLLLLEVVLHTAAALVGSTVTHTLDSSLNSGLNCHMCIGKEQEPAINISQILHEEDIYQHRPLSVSLYLALACLYQTRVQCLSTWTIIWYKSIKNELLVVFRQNLQTRAKRTVSKEDSC